MVKTGGELWLGQVASYGKELWRVMARTCGELYIFILRMNFFIHFTPFRSIRISYFKNHWLSGILNQIFGQIYEGTIINQNGMRIILCKLCV